MVLSNWVIGGEFSKATVYKVRAKVRGGPTVLVAWPGLARGPSVAPYPRTGQTGEGLVTTAGCVRECLPSQSLSPPAGPGELRVHTGGLPVCTGEGWRVPGSGHTEEEDKDHLGELCILTFWFALAKTQFLKCGSDD